MNTRKQPGLGLATILVALQLLAGAPVNAADGTLQTLRIVVNDGDSLTSIWKTNIILRAAGLLANPCVTWPK
jgi:transcriptional regulator GlxA family with amidase domain